MAEFCKQCAAPFPSDFIGIQTSEDTAQGLVTFVLCEGCGPTFVDHTGACMAPDCAGHGHTTEIAMTKPHERDPIKTHYWMKPISNREFDWEATFGDYDLGCKTWRVLLNIRSERP